MRVRYAVTFEFEWLPPVTHRGEATATTIGTCARRAIEEAQRATQAKNWSSMVFVALERLASEPPSDETTTDPPSVARSDDENEEPAP